MKPRRIATTRGAGIGFLLSSIVFVFSWSPLAFLLVPLGAAAGYLLSLAPPRGQRGSAGSESTRLGNTWEKLRAYLAHPSLPVRFLSLLALGTVLFLLSWTAGYYLLPAGTFRAGGLFVGTNSFLIPYPERLAPTFAILERSGPYEMTAFVMVAAATAAWPRCSVRHIFLTGPERVPGPPRVTWQQLVFLLLGIALLAGAAWREASMIVGR